MRSGVFCWSQAFWIGFCRFPSCGWVFLPGTQTLRMPGSGIPPLIGTPCQDFCSLFHGGSERHSCHIHHFSYGNHWQMYTSDGNLPSWLNHGLPSPAIAKPPSQTLDEWVTVLILLQRLLPSAGMSTATLKTPNTDGTHIHKIKIT